MLMWRDIAVRQPTEMIKSLTIKGHIDDKWLIIALLLFNWNPVIYVQSPLDLVLYYCH